MGMSTPAAKPLADDGARRSIADALFTRTQQRVLGLVFGQPERDFAISEIIELVGGGSGAIQRELRRLVESGLVKTVEVHGRTRYQANDAAPIYDELRAIVQKTIGIPEQLREALRPAADKLPLAVLYGSVAAGAATAGSDVDVLLVSDELTLEEAFALLQPAEERLSRRISPTLYSRDELERRRAKGHPFLARVLASPHVVLIGDEDDLIGPR